MSKLLNKPFKTFTWYALVILVCSIPVYYLVVDAIWVEELDEHNQLIRMRIEDGIRNLDLDEATLAQALGAWKSIQPGTSLTEADSTAVKADSIYTISRYNPLDKDMDRLRGLSTYVTIHGKGYHLRIETNVEEADETLLAIAAITFLFFLLLVLGFVLLNRRIARRIWEPFRDTLDRLQAFDLSRDRPVQFPPSDIEEFETLNHTLTRLIQRNIAAFDQQKTFLENASHELQTPLAILKTKTDLLLQHENLTAEQSEMIAAISDTLSRVSRINKNLLLLAKIENHQFSAYTIVDAGEVLRESIDLLEDYGTHKQLTLNVTLHPKQLSCNRTLLEVLVNNLIINAMRHSFAAGEVCIVLKDGILTVSNPGGTPLQQDQLFQRFAVSSSETAGSGLGLAIVREICDRYGWEISYAFACDTHTFSVKF